MLGKRVEGVGEEVIGFLWNFFMELVKRNGEELIGENVDGITARYRKEQDIVNCVNSAF